MIDSGVDINHPALRGQKIKFKSFHRKGRRPGPKVHGTAVATILISANRLGAGCSQARR
jgi:subtilisin family serine protease